MTTETITITRYKCSVCGDVIMDVPDHVSQVPSEYCDFNVDDDKYPMPPKENRFNNNLADDTEPRLTFAGYEMEHCTMIADVHFCSESCKDTFSTTHHVKEFVVCC
jgi:hypothetical protein